MEQNKIVVFESRKIRRIWYNDKWFFSVVDVCGALTDSPDPGAYWRKLKQRLNKEGSEVVTFCHGLKLEAADGKQYTTDCANTKAMFRIIQSIPSPKAEPFKQWLAQVGYDRKRGRSCRTCITRKPGRQATWLIVKVYYRNFSQLIE
jgi:prophage antirepressor-like protein